MLPELDPVAIRVLGSLLEKELTVPASYPLTMNALLSACNQSSGRDPVMSVSSTEADAAIATMKTLQLVRMVHASHGARMVKYRQVADETLELDPPERAVMTVLLLRGAQTPGELRSRSERLHPFASSGEVERPLDRLAGRPEPLVRVLPRQPGHKEQRWVHLLGGEPVVAAMAAVPQRPAVPEPPPVTRRSAGAVSASGPGEPFVPALVPLARFIGTWSGAGVGEYPTIDDFAYTEEIELRPVPGKPMLAYRSTTRAVDGGRVMHGESGWMRIVGDGGIELVISQGPGLVEISEGFVEGGDILLNSTLLAGSSTAKDVTATERRYSVDSDGLHYRIAMAAVGVPLTHHLQARLTRRD